MEIRVISLLNQMQRREKMASMLNEQALPWKFFDAVSGKEIDKYLSHYDRDKRMRFPGHDLTPNEIACFISHRSVWEECASGSKNLLILEDDAYGIRKDHLVKELPRLLESIEKDINDERIIRLGNGAYRTDYSKIKHLWKEFSLVRFRQDPLCALAYVLTPACASKLVQKSEKFYLPVDDFMWNGNESGCIVLDIDPVFFFTPMEGNPSTIGGRVKPKQNFLQKIKREFWRALYRRKLSKYEKNAQKNL